MNQQFHSGYLSKRNENTNLKNTCTPMFTAVLLTIAKTWKQPSCLLMDERIKKTWSTSVSKGNWFQDQPMEDTKIPRCSSLLVNSLYIWGGSKITADGDCSHEIKRHLLLGRKVMTNLDSIFKSRDITLPTKVRLVKAMVFPVVMYGCESLAVKKAECQRIDAFELWCWRRLLRVP